ncbi:hypothetical protein [Bosea sp. (in: a-proteobacteria)]|uniref:hypothetical protein n=1 Tax=Bosea sp. (in: a-proteobacteria) TaxID=1871050 RepID=UPI0026179681|nr:hypothetical protein [Bosea sp. (in: a-proteobacteria)]MCO5092648.1 hypothetical protein [Bosea sp. (in: a-proteobacteria)]
MGGAATYLMAVEGYSLPAIQKAVTRLIRGEFDWFGGRFLPTTAELSRACRYCEDLIAPPKRMALPAPGDVEPTEEEWARRKAQADAARERFGIKPSTGETVADRETMPEALRAQRDKDLERIAAKLKGGSYRLSDEAMAIFRDGLSDRVVPSPDEQYDDWQSRKGEAA